MAVRGRRGPGIVCVLRCAVACVVLCASAAGALSVAAANGGAPRAHAAYAYQCSSDQYPPYRDPSNPLDLPAAPGPNPLHGAHFFVDGPAHGDAANGIEQLLGINPLAYPDSYSWQRFLAQLAQPPYSRELRANPELARRVHLLELIGSEQETQSISEWAMGGTPGATFAQTQKLLCVNLTADHTPHTVPVFSTDFIYPHGQYCPSLGEILANGPTFDRQISELAAGTGRHPVVYLLEIDSVGTSNCLHGAARVAWANDLRYEVQQITALPHTVAYLEAGASDEAHIGFVVHMIDMVCTVRQGHALVNVCGNLRGFFVNDTHFQWSSTEIAWANQVSHRLSRLIDRQTHSSWVAHYVINSAQNGRGPDRNAHPARGRVGIENLCNPPGRGLGRMQTAATAPTFDGHYFPLLDAFLWTGAPGRSHGVRCHPGDAPPGVWFSRFALELAANADQQLGPGFPKQPY